MTFIASVIAKEGIAIVSDSFGTTMEHSLNETNLLEYLIAAEDKEKIPVVDLVRLFEKKASHTRNYIDKLFKFDEFSAITFTGAIYINGKEIKEIVKIIAAELQVDTPAYKAKDINQILDEFCNKLKMEVIEHGRNDNLTSTDLIFSHFNVRSNQPQIFMIKVKEIDKDDFDENDPELVKYDDQSHLKIVTDGQNTFVERLIFGSLVGNVGLVKSEIIERVVDILQLDDENREKVNNSISDFECLKQTVLEDMFSIKFRQLSLQEALDLAALLIKIVMDIQVYTEKIPTVGGLIKLAYIHEEKGFNWISGNELVASNII